MSKKAQKTGHENLPTTGRSKYFNFIKKKNILIEKKIKNFGWRSRHRNKEYGQRHLPQKN